MDASEREDIRFHWRPFAVDDMGPFLTKAMHAETNKGKVSICPNGQRNV
jgi:hypothetical protein